MQKRIIGLDVGDKRIGISLSDTLRITAQGYKTYERSVEKEDIKNLCAICKEFDVEKIVCGLPKNMNGTLGPQSEKVMDFASKLQKESGLELVYWDERLTTVLAERTLLEADISRKKRRKVIDKMAAVVILQSYLDSK